jgi:xanthine dehydrogenase accessory factor
MAGSVSGGCIEGAVVRGALEVLASGRPELMSFTATDPSAWQAGLSCGGTVEVLLRPLDAQAYEAERNALRDDREYLRLLSLGFRPEGEEEGSAAPDALGDAAPDAAPLAPDGDGAQGIPLGATLLVSADGSLLFAPSCAGPVRGGRADDPASLFSSRTGPAGSEGLVAACLDAVCAVPSVQTDGFLELPCEGGCHRFSFARYRRRPHLVCVGGVHAAITLTQMAQAMGYRTTIIDPRGIFSTVERFGHVDGLVHAWPQEAFASIPLDAQTAVCVMTHDAKIDVPALELALASECFYIGSLGRPTTQAQRYRQLRKRGLSHRQLARVFGPIGLDLGGRAPAEMALAILSEITAVRYGKTATSRQMSQFAPAPEQAALQQPA